MKNALILLAIIISFNSCKSSKQNSNTASNNDIITQNDTVRISADNSDYDIIIIEPGFNAWLNSTARPKSMFTLSYLETKNKLFVTAWNNRAMQPTQFNPQLYEMQINYDSFIDYGFDLNYKLYNYFIFFQNTFNQNLLGGYIPQN